MSAIKGVDYIRVFPSSSVLFKELSFFLHFSLSRYTWTLGTINQKKKNSRCTDCAVTMKQTISQ